MSDKSIKRYTLMISAPSDVYNFVVAVKRAIDKYNLEQCPIDNVYFIQKNWRDHAIPGYGERPQEIINNQITNEADLIIALFGAKFGEPTVKYPSGTLEEIETVHKNGGNVLTYFYTMSDKSDFDEQFDKVQEYKNTYNGIYGEFKDENELSDKVYKHLKNIVFSLQEKISNDIKLCSYAKLLLLGKRIKIATLIMEGLLIKKNSLISIQNLKKSYLIISREMIFYYLKIFITQEML